MPDLRRGTSRGTAHRIFQVNACYQCHNPVIGAASASVNEAVLMVRIVYLTKDVSMTVDQPDGRHDYVPVDVAIAAGEGLREGRGASAPSGSRADSTQSQVDDRKDRSAMIPAHQAVQARSSNRAPTAFW